jgi:sec-independent protein translocase protein TatC
MSSEPNGYNDPEDIFKHTRMSLGDHIEELRRHMIKAIIGFLIAMGVGYLVSDHVLKFINRPVEKVLVEIHERRRDAAYKRFKEELAEKDFTERTTEFPLLVKESKAAYELGAEKTDSTPAGWLMLKTRQPMEEMVRLQPPPGFTDKPPVLTSLSAPEVFVVIMKVSVYTGIVLSSPWIFYQLWMFIGAGLYPHEKKYVHIYLPFSLALFLAGVALCEFVVLPVGIGWLLSWNESLGIEPELRLSDWLGFAIMMPLISGIAFQTPLVMFFLERVGIFTTEQYTKHWRIAIFSLTLAGALLAVSPDPLSMMALAVPMCCLYGLGILLCKFMPKHKEDDLDVPEPEEMVEV